MTTSYYAAYGVEEIASKFIEGMPEIANVAVHQDEMVSEMINGIGTESSSIREGTITYDVRLCMDLFVSAQISAEHHKQVFHM